MVRWAVRARALPIVPRPMARQFICMGSPGQWACTAGHAGSGRSETDPRSGQRRRHQAWWPRQPDRDLGACGTFGAGVWRGQLGTRPCAELGPQAVQRDTMNYLVSVAAGVGYASPVPLESFEESALSRAGPDGRVKRAAFPADSAGPGNRQLLGLPWGA